MADLFPTFAVPDIIDTSATADSVPYGKSWQFDFDAGEFVMDGSGRVLVADEYAAWVQWCAKAVLTERFAYLAYSTDHGTETDAAIRNSDFRAVQADLEYTITEALLADPRTGSVEDFVFTRSGEQVNVSFTAVPTVGTSQRVEVTLGG